MGSKLVRDRIPEIIATAGGDPRVRVADSAQYWLSLRDKLREEVEEFLEGESTEELADILEVIDAICDHRQINRNELDKLKLTKRIERGGFAGRLILDRDPA